MCLLGAWGRESRVFQVSRHRGRALRQDTRFTVASDFLLRIVAMRDSSRCRDKSPLVIEIRSRAPFADSSGANTEHGSVKPHRQMRSTLDASRGYFLSMSCRQSFISIAS